MKRIAIIAAGLLTAHTAFAGIYAELVDHNLTTDTTQPKQKICAEWQWPIRRR
jgi:hypothetical protein